MSQITTTTNEGEKPNDEVPLKNKRKNIKPSSKRRIETFRRTTSDKVKNDAKSAIRERLLGPARDELSEILSLLNINQSQQTATVPVTTRGIGFLTNECYNRAVKQVSRAEAVASVNQVYRVSLAQLSMQMHKSDEISGMHDVERQSNQDLFLPDDIRHITAGHTQNFKLVSNAINSIGSLSFQGRSYSPSLESIGQLEIPSISPTHTGGEQAAKRSKAPETRRIFLPDPFLVTLQNLQCTVEAMSNIAVPVAIRKYFVQNNPLPGAIYSDDYLLTNGPTILPDNYSRSELRRDCLAVQGFFGILRSKLGTLLGEVTLDGKGSPSMLVTQYKHEFCLQVNFVMSPSPSRFRAQTVDQMDLLHGALHLMGEYPKDGLPGRNIRFYALREPEIQTQIIDVDWPCLVGRCLAN